jgi:hypothetical protein
MCGSILRKRVPQSAGKSRCRQQAAKYALQNIQAHAIAQHHAQLSLRDWVEEIVVEPLQSQCLRQIHASPQTGDPMPPVTCSSDAGRDTCKSFGVGRAAIAINDPRLKEWIGARGLNFQQESHDILPGRGRRHWRQVSKTRSAMSWTQKLPDVYWPRCSRKDEASVIMCPQDAHKENTGAVVWDAMIPCVERLPVNVVYLQLQKTFNNALEACPLRRGPQAIHILQKENSWPCQPDCLQDFEENQSAEAIKAEPAPSPGKWLTRKAHDIQIWLWQFFRRALLDASEKQFRSTMMTQHCPASFL